MMAAYSVTEKDFMDPLPKRPSGQLLHGNRLGQVTREVHLEHKVSYRKVNAQWCIFVIYFPKVYPICGRIVWRQHKTTEHYFTVRGWFFRVSIYVPSKLCACVDMSAHKRFGAHNIFSLSNVLVHISYMSFSIKTSFIQITFDTTTEGFTTA